MQIVECSMIKFFVIHSRVALLQQVLEPSSNEFLGDAIAAVDGDNCRPLFVTTLLMRRMPWRMSFLPLPLPFLIEWSPLFSLLLLNVRRSDEKSEAFDLLSQKLIATMSSESVAKKQRTAKDTTTYRPSRDDSGKHVNVTIVAYHSFSKFFSQCE